ncbi:uncharacterized protein LOC142324601 isoform X2 [Lycorma delicatula]|uniref:uncharacterized protein LOC142324601 isoform X2 n=1 Tax=Lycorma delicatula TaxID=130591 RepID=UPI003F510196
MIGEAPFIKSYEGSGICNEIESWFQAMGFNYNKIPNVFSRLPKKQIDVWIHIVKHVRPKGEILVEKKNLLINKCIGSQDLSSANLNQFTRHVDRQKQCELLTLKLDEDKQNLNSNTEYIKENINHIIYKDLEKEKLKQNINDVIQKTELLNLKCKQIGKTVNNLTENLNVIDFITNEMNSDGNKEKENEYKDNLKKFLPEIDAYFHSYRLGGGKVDLTAENSALWNKLYEYCLFVPANIKQAFMLEKMEQVNSEMDSFLENCLRERSDTTLPKSLLNYIRGLNIKTCLQNHMILKNIKELEEEINVVKNDICSKVLSIKLSAGGVKFNQDNDHFRNKEEYYKRILNSKYEFARYKIKKNYLKMKTTELKTETNTFEFNKTTFYHQMEKLSYLNSKIAETVKVITKYAGLICNDLHHNANDLHKNVPSQIIKKFNQIDSFEELDNPFVHLKNSIKNEIELFLEIPLEKALQKTDDNFKDVRVYYNSKKHLLIPYNLLHDKIWISVLNQLVLDLNSVALALLENSDEKKLKSKKICENECEEELADIKENIKMIIGSANQACEIGCDYLLLWDSDIFINKALSDEKLPSGRSFKEYIEQFKCSISNKIK